MLDTAVRQRKLYEEVAARLERMIAEGHYAAGDALPSQRTLMETFAVGRPAIREALFHLQKMGLIDIRSGTRAIVTLPTPAFVVDALAVTARHMLAAPGGVQNFQSLRVFFEVGLARHAAEHATADDLARFRAALDENRASLGDLKRFERTDVDFHYVLAVIPRNPMFTAIHAALAEWLLEQRQTTLAPGEDKVAYEAHRAIFEAVAAHDADRAEAAMREHLDYVTRRYNAVVEKRR
jgi:DNA-binding FadR family transcriptional regulator